MGHWGQCPLDFQQFNFSGHFRAAQTLTLDSGCLMSAGKEYTSFVTVYCMDFIIFWCVTLKLFSFGFMPLRVQIPGNANAG